MLLGACTKSFGGMTVAETAEIFAKAGLSCAELCFCQKELSGWKYNFSGYEPLPDVADVLKASEIFGEFGIKICAVGVYNCLWQGSFQNTEESLKYLREYCDIAASIGVKLITTHTGTMNHLANSAKSSTDFKTRVYESFTQALAEAAKRGLTIAAECAPSDILTGYEDYLRLKNYVCTALGTSDMLKYIGVPALGDTCEDIDEIALFHLKDKKTDGKFYERFGNGDGDFTSFFKKLPQIGETPVILEYVNSGNLAETVIEFSRKVQ